MNRRRFLSGLASAAALASSSRPAPGASPQPDRPRIRLGIDNFAVRAMGWKAPDLIRYAASIRCDTLLISDLDAIGSLDDAALREVRSQADAAGIGLYVGSWSICPTSKAFRKNWGTAEEHVRLGLRVSKALGSPVFRVVLGTMEDRKTEGGIRARMADTLAVLRACRRDALASGVKIALENHAGDLHSWELRQLIDDAGHDFVGANLDTGNAFWTLEDPLDVLETLGPVALCSSLRDGMVWETQEGAAVQWTAAGDGLIDWRQLAARWAKLCPQTPIMIETISGGPRQFPYKQAEFWTHYDKRPDKLAKFEALAKRGRQIPAFKAPPGPEGKKATQDFQKAELEKSIAYLRREIGLGLRA
ncbi:MAG: sugar phosphate isomerase/epimerase [Verrucomicrobia bacterium]|nr:sugar phosphate isomerase/epimerase [Verrucomicrobiota bacterium]